MNDLEKQQRFIQLRAQGWSFARIGEELQVSKPTLINWSRKQQFQIQNHRAILMEQLQERWLSGAEARINSLGEQLKRVEAELANRDVSELTTGQLFHLAESLRRLIKAETGPMTFTTATRDIPSDEYCEQVQDWKP